MPDMITKIRAMKVHGPSKDKDLNGSTNLLDEGGSSLKKQKALGNKCDGVSKTSSFCQSRPRGLFQLIEKFNITQKDDIRSIEFGGLLHLHLKKMLPPYHASVVDRAF